MRFDAREYKTKIECNVHGTSILAVRVDILVLCRQRKGIADKFDRVSKGVIIRVVFQHAKIGAVDLRIAAPLLNAAARQLVAIGRFALSRNTPIV